MFVYVFNAPTYHKDKAPRRKREKNNTNCDKNTNNKKYKPQSKSERGKVKIRKTNKDDFSLY